jgi:hypothetical protein
VGTDSGGWHLDPFDRHEHRWFSEGAPTRLVRDAGVESYDPPPEPTWAGELTPVAEQHRAGAEELRRAGQGPGDHYDPGAAADAALDSSAASGLGFS